ncbi:MAG: 3-hydroxyacyl-ACP dehydratase [Bacteroidota bacterium]
MICPVSGEEILKLIPQRSPFVMIDTLVSCGEKSAETTFTIPNDNLFLNQGLFREPGLIENIAQSAAAMNGFAGYPANQEAKIGFIAAIKDLKINKLPHSGQTIRTQVVFVDEVFDYQIIRGKIFNNNDIFAECEMKIFIKNN